MVRLLLALVVNHCSCFPQWARYARHISTLIFVLPWSSATVSFCQRELGFAVDDSYYRDSKLGTAELMAVKEVELNAFQD